jgi:hypothetical protein
VFENDAISKVNVLTSFFGDHSLELFLFGLGSLEFFFFTFVIHLIVDFKGRSGQDLKQGLSIVMNVEGFAGGIFVIDVFDVVDLEVDILIGVSK